ncbi:F-box domain-containing protein [Mycena kentingensis (nom. inval.)]|nr:F-box domain-containing protein [Mycena kentingensis (nom. inval.)]
MPRTESMSGATLRQQLVNIDTETAALNARLSALATEREQVVAALKRVVYPIIDIPLELTAEILRHFVNDGQHDVGSRWRTHAALVAASVCGVWRSVALATPALWSTLNLQHRGRRSPSHRHCSPHVDGTRMPHRRLCDEAPLRGEATLDVERLIHLQTLSLKPARRSGTALPLVTFASAPALRAIRIDGITSRWSELASSRLTSLSLRQVDTAECLAALGQTSALETLELIHLKKHVPPTAQGVILSHLRTLTLELSAPYREETLQDEDDVQGYIMPLLEQLTLPSLTTLNMQGGAVPENFTRLCKLIQRSQCTVTHLSLTEIDYDDGLDELLNATPELRSIRLSEAGVLRLIDDQPLSIAASSLVAMIAGELEDSGFRALQHVGIESDDAEYPADHLQSVLRVLAAAGGASSLRNFEYSNTKASAYVYNKVMDRVDAALAAVAASDSRCIVNIQNSRGSKSTQKRYLLYCLGDDVQESA